MLLKEVLIPFISPEAIKVIRGIRCFYYYILSPFELLLGIANKENPPAYLKRVIGTPKHYKSSGEEFKNILLSLSKLQPYESVLDIGCGCGSVTIPLTKYLNKDAKYIGIDVYKPGIEWCKRNISKTYDNFSFFHVDVNNPIYNSSNISSNKCKINLNDEYFDSIFLKSVFTHMNPEEINNYLSEIYRMLKPSGRCIATFFLMNEKQKQLEADGHSQMIFKYGDDDWKYLYQNSPYTGCAQRQSLIENMITANNLRVETIVNGRWIDKNANKTEHLQDIIIIKK